ncbi:uncharacterized protein TRAVEDRAFT_48944 [Trametes versicolor FP-101664 SS1]|uniref:uncharacterized protein n=1 Tax=Trametes versicolor (strain FP-101664) TaxID=717944 RepID=UPI00046227AD|nr:uncharacterized protein TRAVEDRAFT_48944 [Trametes versicolor FP-101664 SS1]EIW57921.1 hypothetical protein TRAVEDRAFT_48944 [Trametes versicolor FP-101664 SS1]
MDMDSTFGALLIGTLVGTTLYGMTILQIYRYFRTYPNDCTANSLLVYALAVLETFHVMISAHACYFYLVTSYGHPEALSVGVWSINILSVVSGVTIILSQSFFARRVYLIGTSFRLLVLVAVVLLVGELGFFTAATAQAFIFPRFMHFQRFTWMISAGAAMAVVADGLLTSVLVTVLRRNSTGMKRLDTIVDILILYAISTGLLTSVVNFLSFIFSLANPNNLVYSAFGIVATRLYANSLLAALNSRKYLAERAAGDVFSSSLVNVRATRALPYAGSVSFTIVSPTTFRPPVSQYIQSPLSSPTFPPTPRMAGFPSPSTPRV